MLDKKVVSQCVSADYCQGWNDAVDAMPHWISVEDRLPEEGKIVLLIARFGNAGMYVTGWRVARDGIVEFVSPHTDLDCYLITHWMPPARTAGGDQALTYYEGIAIGLGAVMVRRE